MANGAEVWQMVQKYGKWCRSMTNGAEVWQMVQKYGKWCSSMANGAEVWQMVQKYGKWCRSMANGAEVWQIPTREINKILSTGMNVLRRSAKKSRMERTKNEL